MSTNKTTKEAAQRAAETVPFPTGSHPAEESPEAMLAEARRIHQEALQLLRQAQSVKQPSALTAEQREQDRLRGEEPVEVLLFKDNGRYREDVFVSVNGETAAIRRGERVTVKRKFWEVLENSRRQDDAAARLMERQADLFRSSGL